MRNQPLRYRLILTSLILMLFVAPTSAQDLSDTQDTKFCFSAEDFTLTETSTGIYLTEVPSYSVARIMYGNRVLRAGDAVPVDQLSNLTVETYSKYNHEAAVLYYPVSGNTAISEQQLKFSILPKKDLPPEAEDDDFETYRNITYSGDLEGEDPENGRLTFQLVTGPKRGSVVIEENGAFTYTPDENKVGKDSFTFTVTDDSGQISEPAKISIEIKRPSDKRVYADMSNDPDTFYAMWLKEKDLFCGSQIGDNLCFEPDMPVTRGQFLVMAMKLVDAQADTTAMSSGFYDEQQTSPWLRPYIVSALGNGMISGSLYETGMEFRPNDHITEAEAAVMLQNILQLPSSDIQPVSNFETDDTIPAWAKTAVSALSEAGIKLSTAEESFMTHMDTAKMLYQVSRLLEDDSIPTFYWSE